MGYGIAYGRPGSYTIMTTKKAIANSSKYIQITEGGAAGCLLSNCTGTYKVSDSTTKMYCVPGDESSKCTVTTSNRFPGDSHDITDTHAMWTTQYTYSGDTKYCGFSQCADGYNLSGNTCKKQKIPCSPPKQPDHSNNKTVCKDGQWIVPGCDDGPVITYEPTKDGHACKASGCINTYGSPGTTPPCSIPINRDTVKKLIFGSSDAASNDILDNAISSKLISYNTTTDTLEMARGNTKYPMPWSGCGDAASYPEFAMDMDNSNSKKCEPTVATSTSAFWSPYATDPRPPSTLKTGGCILGPDILCPPGVTPLESSNVCQQFPAGYTHYNETDAAGKIMEQLDACVKNATTKQTIPSGFSFGKSTVKTVPLAMSVFTIKFDGVQNHSITLIYYKSDCTPQYNSGNISTGTAKTFTITPDNDPAFDPNGWLDIQTMHKKGTKKKHKYAFYTTSQLIQGAATNNGSLAFTLNSGKNGTSERCELTEIPNSASTWPSTKCPQP